jgi:ABC-2 type transport system permease protein
MMRFASDTYYLTLRALRETTRQPALEIGNVFIPIFFFAVTVGAIGSSAARAFGVENYTGFQMPIAVLQGVAGAAGVAGIATVTDIERGYFDKLLLTPASRITLAMGRLAADVVRITVLSAFILVVGLIFGSGLESGPLGGVVLVLMAGAFGLAYSGIGMALALKTGSAQAAQLGFLIFFPLLFLSPAFAPKEFFSPWLEFLATINPVTYIVEGMRSLVLDGWDAAAIAKAFAAIVGMGAFTLSLVVWGLRSRTA